MPNETRIIQGSLWARKINEGREAKKYGQWNDRMPKGERGYAKITMFARRNRECEVINEGLTNHGQMR